MENNELFRDSLTPHEQAVLDSAAATIRNIIVSGRRKHVRDSFVHVAPDFHLDRAIRHICSAKLMRDGNQRADEDGVDGHLENALARVAMAVYRMQLHVPV